jgi:phospholipid/cholesterol/gamma-HCH transport system ATP-binding protein
VRGVTHALGPKVIQHDLEFDVRRGSIFAAMGGSGCGKSTVLKAMVGLLHPARGTTRVDNEDYWAATEARRTAIGRRFGVLFQSGAGLPEAQPGRDGARPRPASLRTQRRHAQAGRAGRALALDPDVLFFDEPLAGLDPITSSRLDDLILNLLDGLGATIVTVSHELPSLFAIADDGVFLDAITKTAIAHGSPASMRDSCKDPQVEAFMRRERPEALASGQAAAP